ncbi:type IV pilus assembly protein PilM [Bdellovibrionota bacterium]
MFRSRVVGLDIGSHGIKMAEVAANSRGYQLINFGTQSLPRHAIAVREIIDFNAVSDAIRILSEKMGLRRSPIVLSLSGPGTFIKRIQLEGVRENELSEVIHWEGAQWIPFPVDESQIDYEVLGVDHSQRKVDLVLVAAQKQLIQSYTSCVLEAGLTPAVLDVDAFAIQNTFETNYSVPFNQVSALLHIGESVSTLHLLQDGGTLWVRDLILGGERLTSRIQEKLRLDYAEAETLKIGMGSGTVPSEVVEEVNGYIDDVVGEVSKVLAKFYQETPATDPLSSLFLSGGGSQLPGLAKALHKELQVTTEIVRPFRRLSVRKGISTPLETVAPIAAVCVGLAARRGIPRAKG